MIILKVFQDNIPRDKKDIVTFKVEKVFLKSQLEEQGYVLIEKSKENNPKPPKLEATLRRIIMDYTGKGHTGGGFTNELREETINEIIDHLPQEKEDKIYSCACCFIAHGEGKMCPIHESSPDKEKIFITQKTDTSCSGKGYAIKTCCGNRVIKYSGTLTQEQLDTLLCENCHKPMPKQPTKEEPDIRIVDTNILWQKLQDRGFDHVQASEAIKVIQAISALYRKDVK